MDADELRDADRAIIDVLREGRNNAPNISERTGYSKQYIRERLKRLADEGLLTNIGSGIYELIPEEVPENEHDT
jgi:DNA-binding Lrp family transcriptional regulator